MDLQARDHSNGIAQLELTDFEDHLGRLQIPHSRPPTVWKWATEQSRSAEAFVATKTAGTASTRQPLSRIAHRRLHSVFWRSGRYRYCVASVRWRNHDDGARPSTELCACRRCASSSARLATATSRSFGTCNSQVADIHTHRAQKETNRQQIDVTAEMIFTFRAANNAGKHSTKTYS